MIDPSGVRYHPHVLLSGGELLPLGRALLGLQWEEQPGQLATRLDLRVANVQTSRGWLHQVLALAGKVLVLAEWGAGQQEVFRGTIWRWQYADAGAAQVQITCYDDLHYLMRSSDDYLFPAETLAADALLRIFQDWGVPVGVVQGPFVRLPKLPLRGSLGDAVFTILTESFYRGGQEFFVRARPSSGQIVVDVVRPAQNSPVYHLRADRSVSEFNDEQDMEDLITEVRIVGEQSESLPGDPGDPEVRPALDEVIVNPVLALAGLGRIRDVVIGQENDSPGTLRDRALAILAERGAPHRIRRLIAPDLPFLRKGDAVRVTAGTLVGALVPLTGISHDADARRMTLTIDSSGTFTHRRARGETEDAKTGLPDDPVGAPLAPAPAG